MQIRLRGVTKIYRRKWPGESVTERHLRAPGTEGEIELSERDSKYYADRARAERRLREAADDPRAAAAHAELAARYEALAADPSLKLPGPEAAALHSAAG